MKMFFALKDYGSYRKRLIKLSEISDMAIFKREDGKGEEYKILHQNAWLSVCQEDYDKLYEILQK